LAKSKLCSERKDITKTDLTILLQHHLKACQGHNVEHDIPQAGLDLIQFIRLVTSGLRSLLKSDGTPMDEYI